MDKQLTGGKKGGNISCSEDEGNLVDFESQKVSEKANLNESTEATHDTVNSAILVDDQDLSKVESGRAAQALIYAGDKEIASPKQFSGEKLNNAAGKTSYSTDSNKAEERTEETDKTATRSTSLENNGAYAADQTRRSNNRLSSISFDSSRLKRLSVVRKSHLEAGEHSRIKSWDMRRHRGSSKPLFPSAGGEEHLPRMHTDFSESLALKYPNIENPSSLQVCVSSAKRQQEQSIHRRLTPREELEPNLRSLRNGIDKRSLRALVDASQKIPETSSAIKLTSNQLSNFNGCVSHEHPKSDRSTPPNPHPVPEKKASYSYLQHLQLVSQPQRANSHSDPEDSQDLISQEPEEELSLNCLFQLGNLMEGRVVVTDSAASSLTCADHGNTFHGLHDFQKHIRKCITAFTLLFILSIAFITSWQALKSNTLHIPVAVKPLSYHSFADKFYKLLQHVNDSCFDFILREKESKENSIKSDYRLSRRFELMVGRFSSEVTVVRDAKDAGRLDEYIATDIDTMKRFLAGKIWNYLAYLMGSEFFSTKEIYTSLSSIFLNYTLHLSEQLVLQPSHSGPQFIQSVDWKETMQIFMTTTKPNRVHSFRKLPSLHGQLNNTRVSKYAQDDRSAANDGPSQILLENHIIIPRVTTNTSTALSATSITDRIMKCNLPDPIFKTQISKQLQTGKSKSQTVSKNGTMIPHTITPSSGVSSVAIYKGENALLNLYFYLDRGEFEIETVKPNKLFAQHAFLRRRLIADASNMIWQDALITDVMPYYDFVQTGRKSAMVEVAFENEDKPLMEIVNDLWMSFLKRKLRRLRRLLGFEGLIRKRRRFGRQLQINM